MRIHTDKLNAGHLIAACEGMPNVALDWTEHGSRKRKRAFEVRMAGEPGKDRHGITRRFSTGGAYGSTDGTMRALTWIEWGDWMVELFKTDPGAIIGPYHGAHEFVSAAYDASHYRPPGENAPAHAEGWGRELYYARREQAA